MGSKYYLKILLIWREGLGWCCHCLVGGRKHGHCSRGSRACMAGPTWLQSYLCCLRAATQDQQTKPLWELQGPIVSSPWECLWSRNSHSSEAHHIIKMSPNCDLVFDSTPDGIKLLLDTFLQGLKMTKVCNVNNIKLKYTVYFISQAIGLLMSTLINICA